MGIRIMNTNFTLNGPTIKPFFSGENENPPISELRYLHTHPLIQPNFVSEIENMAQEVGEKLKKAKVDSNSEPVKELTRIAIDLGRTMSSGQLDDPGQTLLHLRELYNFCNRILGRK